MSAETRSDLLPGATQRRYFVSYSGVRLPFRLVTELSESEVENRNTYFQADFDDAEHLIGFDKMVYGELEMSHRYRYYPSGALQEAEVTNHAEDDTKVIPFPDTASAET
jgi:hypothetical protein